MLGSVTSIRSFMKICQVLERGNRGNAHSYRLGPTFFWRGGEGKSAKVIQLVSLVVALVRHVQGKE